MALPEYLDIPATTANRATMRVVTAVAEFFFVEPERIFTKDRLKSVALARQVSMFVLYEHQHPKPSTPEVGREFGRDHSTVLHSLGRVRRLIGNDDTVRDAVETGRAALDSVTIDDEIRRLGKLRHRADLLKELQQVEEELAEGGR